MNNKIKQSTLDGITTITSMRRDGNTTRLIDHAIQILFQGKVCICKDHYDDGNDKRANKYLFDRIYRRLQFDHGLDVAQIKVDFMNLEIELSNE